MSQTLRQLASGTLPVRGTGAVACAVRDTKAIALAFLGESIAASGTGPQELVPSQRTASVAQPNMAAEVPSIAVSVNIAHGAQPFGGRGSESLARRRYQQGSLYLRKGKRRRVWVARWLEDVIEDGHVRRVHRREVLGTQKDFPTEKLARRELDARLAAVNSVNYRPRPAATFLEFASRWETTVLTQHKPSTQATIRSQIRKYLVPFLAITRCARYRPKICSGFCRARRAVARKRCAICLRRFR